MSEGIFSVQCDLPCKKRKTCTCRVFWEKYFFVTDKDEHIEEEVERTRQRLMKSNLTCIEKENREKIHEK
jgi:hypothetical protein